jgi:integrase/recombinase XerD
METKKSVDIATAFCGVEAVKREKISELTEGFLEYARYELNFSPETIVKYRDSLKCFVRDVGDKAVSNLDVQDFVRLKRLMIDRGLSEARISSVIFAVRSFLHYCRDFLKIETLNPKQIRPPKRVKREVIFLSKEEIEAFIGAIDISRWNGLRFRTLVEVLLGTGMRISEALSLNRKSIDWERKEAKIVGKGNKERRVFFTERALSWIKKYLESRHDNHEAIFITKGEPKRLTKKDIWRYFKCHREKAKIYKKLTPHIIRHTVATNLVFNGCPIVHVKEILGHDKLDTTCKYYLGIDREQAKRAHKKYLDL